MKTLEQVLASYESNAMDSRDTLRLAMFVPEDMLHRIGIEKTTPECVHIPKPYTRDNIIDQLRKDVEFGFDKAIDRRGISASMMYEVVMMLNWILEEGLEDFSKDDYAQYGLPLFKATALKYGFDNPIGDDEGNEDRYAAHYNYPDDSYD